MWNVAMYGTEFHHWCVTPLAFAEVFQVIWLAHFIHFIAGHAIAEYLLVIEYFFGCSEQPFDDISQVANQKELEKLGAQDSASIIMPLLPNRLRIYPVLHR